MRHRQRAQVIVWVAVMVPLVFLPILGLTMDAGVLFDARRGLQNVADGAARVGAMEIDTDDLLHNTTGQPHLRPHDAENSAYDYVHRSGFARGDADANADRDHIVVTVHREVGLSFLHGLLHVPNPTIHATGQAAPCAGVTDNRFTCTS